LLRSIFRVSDDDVATLKELRTGATKATTDRFFSFTIQTPLGLKVRFTDGPGLGEQDPEYDRDVLIPDWISEIQKHDLLYWVLDAPSRDIAHIPGNMKRILDATGFRDRFLLVLNKVDNIQLEESDRLKGAVGWNERFNVPSKKLERQIKLRTSDIISRFVKKVGLVPDQIVACSALRRWNHDVVLDLMLALCPEDKQIKVALNRDVKPSTELMAPEVRARLEAEFGD